MSLEEMVASHYGEDGLLGRIDVALSKAGLDPQHLGIDDLKPMDEMHTGGAEATAALLDPLGIADGMAVIDLGCGIGGAARHMVHRYGARVRGIDLTEDFVAAGRALTARLGLDDKVTLVTGSVLDLPFEAGSADLVTMLHVGMNIADKPRVFAEAARVLRPGGRFAVYDIMAGDGDGNLVFPLPWARETGASHVEASGIYRRAAHAAGLIEKAERNRRDFAIDFAERTRRRIAIEGRPVLGPHVVMGADMGDRAANFMANVRAGRIAPVEMIFERPAQ